MSKELFLFSLHLADNALVLAQRNSEWTGHGPVLEQDIAITNISLDHLGQARNLYQLAANAFNETDLRKEVDPYIPHPWKEFNREMQEDDLAFLRDDNQYLNYLILELPRGDWAFSILRQFFFSAFQFLQYRELMKSNNASLAGIAEKSIKEVEYHLRWSAEWVIRLGEGTEESRERILSALQQLAPFTGEFFKPVPFELSHVDSIGLRGDWMERVTYVFEQANLPADKAITAGWSQTGGKEGKHTEHLSYMLHQMQYMQRRYPNAIW